MQTKVGDCENSLTIWESRPILTRRLQLWLLWSDARPLPRDNLPGSVALHKYVRPSVFTTKIIPPVVPFIWTAVGHPSRFPLSVLNWLYSREIISAKSWRRCSPTFLQMTEV
jgi:hypothetical protein